MSWKSINFLKLREEAPPEKVLGQWRYGVNDEGVSLSLWHQGAPLQLPQWPQFHNAGNLLALWPHAAVTSSAVRFSHEVVADMPDYDALRLGLPRHIDADMWVTLDGRPESSHMSVRFEFLPFAHHRKLENIGFQQGMLTHKGQEFRLRKEQYHALLACRTLQEKQDFDAMLDAYTHLYLLRHQSRNMGVHIEGYLPRLQVEEARYFNLHPTAQGMMLMPHLPYDDFSPVSFGAAGFRPWQTLWHSGEALPNAWLLPQHRYVRLGEAWRNLLERMRPALRDMHQREDAKAWIMQQLPAEMRFSVR